MHRSLRRMSIALVAAACVAFAIAAPSGAGDSISVSGGATPTNPSPLVPRVAGENFVFDAVGTHAWTGDFTGTSTIDVHFVVHDLQSLTYQGFITFTGTTPCGTGTVKFASSGEGAYPGPIYGKATTIDASDASVAVHAQLDLVLFLPPAGAVVTYAGNVRCG